MRILITGAAGSGTTTLGRALAERLVSALFDTDDYFWQPTEPPYQQQRTLEERRALLAVDLAACQRAVISGSLSDYGEEIEHSLSLVVFLLLDTEIRVRRLMERETRRFGKADPEFIEWAGQYEEGRLEGRSRARQEAWLAQRRCPVLRLEGDLSIQERLNRVLAIID